MSAAATAPPYSAIAPPSSTSKAGLGAGGSSGSRVGPNSGGGPRVEPSFRGILDSTLDALLLFEASRRGLIPRITKRLADEQRQELIKSGSIFIFEEEESGIKRWTDGLIWSPSRILGNYLVYRQTEQRNSRAPRSGSTGKGGKKSKAPLTPPSPGTDSRRPSLPVVVKKEPLVRPAPPPASKRSFSSTPVGLDPASLLGLSAPNADSGLHQYFPAREPRRFQADGDDLMDDSDDDVRDLEELMRIKERSLVGSLTNSYAFKEGGLVKRTMSMLINGKTQHLVSYYTLADGMTDQLRTPSSMPEFADLHIDHELLAKQQFRFPPVIELGLDGVLRYVSEADNSQQSPEPGSPDQLSKEVTAAVQPIPRIPQPHPYYGQPGRLSSSYPHPVIAPPLPDTTFSGALQFPGYSMNSSGASMIGYGAPSHSTYSASILSAQQWSSSLPKEFHHPTGDSPLHAAASIGSPFASYHPLPPPKPNRSNSAGPGPQRRRRASQTTATAATVTTVVPEGRPQTLVGSPFNQPNRPLAPTKPSFHPYAMPSPTEGWTAFHPSSNKSPSTRSSYFDGEPSVFAGGPLSGAIASAPSSAGSSLSAGSGVAAIPIPGQQQTTLTPAMNTAVLGPPGGSAKRLSINYSRESKSFNSPRHRRSPSIQPSPLRTSDPLPAFTEDRARSPYPIQPMQTHQHNYDAPLAYGTIAPHDAQGGRDGPSPYNAWVAPPQPQPSYGSYYDPHAANSSEPMLPHEQHAGGGPGLPTSSYFHPSPLMLHPTSFADDKRSASLALDQLHFGNGAAPRLPSPEGRRKEYDQLPSGMVGMDERRNSLTNYSIQPPASSQSARQQTDEPAQRYWAA